MTRPRLIDASAYATPLRRVEPATFTHGHFVRPWRPVPGAVGGVRGAAGLPGGSGSPFNALEPPTFGTTPSGAPPSAVDLARILGEIPAIRDLIAADALDDLREWLPTGKQGAAAFDLGDLGIIDRGGADGRLGGPRDFGAKAGHRDRTPGGIALGGGSLLAVDKPPTRDSYTQEPSHRQWPNMDAGAPDAGTSGGADAGTSGEADAGSEHDAPDGGAGGDAGSTYWEGVGYPTAVYESTPGFTVLEYNGGFEEEGGYTIVRETRPGDFPTAGPGPDTSPNPDGSPTVAEVDALYRLLGYFHPATSWGQQRWQNPRQVRPPREEESHRGPKLVVPGLADEPPGVRASPRRAIDAGELRREMWGGHGPRPAHLQRALRKLAGALRRP